MIISPTFLPLFAFQRIEAKLFYPMAYAIGYAQLGALLFALVAVPGLAYLAYRRPRRVFRNRVLEWIEAAYRRALEGSLRRPGIVYTLAAGAAGAPGAPRAPPGGAVPPPPPPRPGLPPPRPP